MRLNRGGNRQANAALYRVAIVRMRDDDRTKAYADRRTSEGKTGAKSYAASSDTSSAKYTAPCAPHRPGHPPLDKHRSINALAETINGLFKAEVINFLGPWKSMAQVEWETLQWVSWYNAERLHSALGHITPEEAEEALNESSELIDDAA